MEPDDIIIEDLRLVVSYAMDYSFAGSNSKGTKLRRQIRRLLIRVLDRSPTAAEIDTVVGD